MIGITSFGGYIPRLRLNRMAIYESLGWYAPAIVMVAQGERSFGNWDEDSLTMAVAAARDCLIGQDRAEVDAVYLGSTTLPFADRQCAGVLKACLNLPDDIATADFTTSLRAGTTALATALAAVKGGERKRVLVTASDMRQTRAATFYEMWFGDGAASLLVGDRDVVAEYVGAYSSSHDFIDHYRAAGRKTDYTWEERWVRDEGYAKIIPEAVTGLLTKVGWSMDEISSLIYPCFFKAEHKKIASKLGAAPEKVADNLHELCGETGAAHPLVMLVQALEKAKPGDRIVVAGFGQGCDALAFRVTEQIARLPERTGISGSLKNKVSTDSYARFLLFRDLIDTDPGIRAEAPSQAAPTVIWRKRDLLHGLVGGRCTKCGTPQLPRQDICVNPECNAVRTQEPYPFADEPARVKSFTGDMLAVSMDPPAIYGLVEFDGGGRFMADFTDCVLDDVRVGQPVKLVWRRRVIDRERGFRTYFWKAVPQPVPGEEAQAIRLDGQVAIVTGAGAGLGRAYALELARRGARVVVNDLGVARDGRGEGAGKAADEVVAEIEAAGGEAVASYDSVATAEGGAAVVRAAVDAWGRVDILVSNAGILRDRSLVKLEPDDWRAVRSVHLDGAFYVTRAALPHMKERGYGRILLTTSAAGLYGNFGQSNYSAAKLGLVGFMNTLKLEGRKYDIKVNTVAPMAHTRLTDDILPPDLKERLRPEFVVPLVIYLASERCSVSGEIFNAGMGCFNRAAVVAGPGRVVGDGQRVPALEEIHQHWEAICSLEGAVEHGDATSALGAMLEAFEPKKPAADRGGEDELTVARVFERMPAAFQADKAGGVQVVFQYEISGPGGGSWICEIETGGCTVKQGKHDAPTTTIKMAAPDFLALIQGELNAMKAFTSGKLKISGDVMKSQLIEKLFRF
ncbi:MAG: SDR family NAD(P)-dependent oxidoreductase [Deltaproteobacteria bacterium]|nr:SDR family NAD(P)-dependent oxidoreductase [Deltaproteobacteria bacterium]